MTRKEAYDILCNHFKDKPAVVTCAEYEDYWAFRIAPAGQPLVGKVFVGPMILVDKKNKSVLFEDDVDKSALDRTKRVRHH